jgi:hypothetical protein
MSDYRLMGADCSLASKRKKELLVGAKINSWLRPPLCNPPAAADLFSAGFCHKKIILL